MKLFSRLRDPLEYRCQYLQLFTSLHHEGVKFIADETSGTKAVPSLDSPKFTGIVDAQGIIKSFRRGNISTTTPFQLRAYNGVTLTNEMRQRMSTDYIIKNYSLSQGDLDEVEGYASLVIKIDSLTSTPWNMLGAGKLDSFDDIELANTRDSLTKVLDELHERYIALGCNLKILVESAQQGIPSAMRKLSELVREDTELQEFVTDMIVTGAWGDSDV